MNAFSTTAEEQAEGFRHSASLGIQNLIDYLQHMKAELDSVKSGAFCADWGRGMMERATGIVSEIGRCNGAVLVEAKR